MADERLVNYIRESLNRGYPVESVRQTLINQGWDVNTVNEAINAVQGYAPPPEPAPPTEPVAAPVQPTTPAIPAQRGLVPSRPTGVTVMCILGFIVSILLIVGGVFSVIFGGVLGAGLLGGGEATGLLGALGSYLMIIGAVLLVLGLVELFAFYLVLKMKRMGWLMVTILGIIIIILSVISFNIMAIVLHAIIVGYLFIKRELFV